MGILYDIQLIWWAFRDSIIHAAYQIKPSIILVSMCITVLICYYSAPFLILLIERLPRFRRKREKEQNEIFKEEIKILKAKYADKCIKNEELENRCLEQERIIAMERNTNRYFNAQASMIVKR